MFDAVIEGAFYEFPSFEVALFSIVLSFVLSSVIAFTYHLTSRGGAFSRNFFQAMVLSSIVTCMVIMAVGDNLAAGIGVIGAIAIIRFRMRIENPRNIIFIFAALSVGIAAGVYGYSIALAGTGAFCVLAYLLYLSPYGGKHLAVEFNLYFTLLNETEKSVMYELLREYCQDYRFLKVTNGKRGDRYEYFVTLKKDIDKEEFYQRLKTHEGLANIRMERSDNLERI